ncbi:hypothetical protein BH11BAC3_BH11BAC3_03620 [soil metagenome]
MKLSLTTIAVAAILFAGCQHPASDTKTLANKDSIVTVQWKVHDMNRPRPQVIEPLNQNLPTPAPAGAIILFKAGDISAWKGSDSSGTPKWKLANDYMEIVPGTGAITSKERFGDIFLHAEWASPDDTTKHGQDRGNSGIYFMGKYEIQVLDSYQADTYADGQAGAIYAQYPPLFNACKPRGEWNAYDIAFRAPRFAKDGSLLSPARITVLHNGILIQDNMAYRGPSSWLKFYPYEAHADKLPITLQEHNGKVRFRNIWVLPIPALATPPEGYGDKTITVADADLDKYTGTYERANQNAPILVTKKDGKLYADFFWRKGDLQLLPIAENEFALKETAGVVSFKMDASGVATSLVFRLGGDDMPAAKVPK